MSEWSEEHSNMADLFNRVAYLGGSAVEAPLMKAKSAFDASLTHHNKNNFREAHNQLQIVGEHIGTAAALGAANGADPYYGQSMIPKDVADMHARSYKHAYLS